MGLDNGITLKDLRGQRWKEMYQNLLREQRQRWWESLSTEEKVAQVLMAD